MIKSKTRQEREEEQLAWEHKQKPYKRFKRPAFQYTELEQGKEEKEDGRKKNVCQDNN